MHSFAVTKIIGLSVGFDLDPVAPDGDDIGKVDEGVGGAIVRAHWSR